MKIINSSYKQAEVPYQLVLVYFLFCDKNTIGPEINDNTVWAQSLGRGATTKQRSPILSFYINYAIIYQMDVKLKF